MTTPTIPKSDTIDKLILELATTYKTVVAPDINLTPKQIDYLNHSLKLLKKTNNNDKNLFTEKCLKSGSWANLKQVYNCLYALSTDGEDGERIYNYYVVTCDCITDSRIETAIKQFDPSAHTVCAGDKLFVHSCYSNLEHALDQVSINMQNNIDVSYLTFAKALAMAYIMNGLPSGYNMKYDPDTHTVYVKESINMPWSNIYIKRKAYNIIGSQLVYVNGQYYNPFDVLIM